MFSLVKMNDKSQRSTTLITSKPFRLIFLLAIIGIAAFFSVLCIHEGHNWGDDFALYIEQAKAFKNSSMENLFEMNKFSMDHSKRVIGPYLYPPGFPCLLSFILEIKGIDFVILKLFCSAFFVGSLFLVYLLFGSAFKKSYYSLFIVAGVAFHSAFLTFSDSVLSDFPFLFFCLLSLYLIQNAKAYTGYAFLGIMFFCTIEIRDIGIVLLPTFFVRQFQYYSKVEGMKRVLQFSIPYVFFMVLFIPCYLIFSKGGSNHWGLLIKDQTLHGVYEHLVYYADLVTRYFFWGRINFFLILILAFFIILGVWVSLKEYIHFVVFSLLLFLILIIWPAYQGYRFLFPLLPFIIFFTLKGVEKVFSTRRAHNFYEFGFLFLFFTSFSIKELSETYKFSQRDTNEAYTSEMIEIYNFIAVEIPKNKIIGFEKPRVLRLFSGRNAIFSDYDFFSLSVAEYLLIHKSEYKEKKYVPLLETSNYILVSKHK